MAGRRCLGWMLFLLLLSSVGGSTATDATTLCGETERKETGYLNDLYFLLYRSRLEHATSSSSSNGSLPSIPVLLWLSGGPGCSGVVAALFENGPCAFDEDKSEAVLNPFAWTSVAHVLYIDQPYGTGFSQHVNDTQRPWTNFDAARNLHIFLDTFFARHRDLRSNPFFIVGESYGGHYAPDIAVRLLKLAPERWAGVLKGVGIGNGYTSPRATLASYLSYSQQNAYGIDFLSDWYAVSDFKDNVAACIAYIDNCSTDVPRVISPASHCNDAQPCVDASNQFWSSLRYKGVNVFDVRKQCAKEDSASLCYHFSRLQNYVNTPEHRSYFGVTDQQPSWAVCSNAVEEGSSAPDYFLESEYEVAYLLDHDVPVLIYAGDADPVCNWMAQDQWTRDLKWKHAAEFDQAQMISWPSEDVVQRYSHGLTFAKVRASGHMVPHDQPQVALELLRRFIGSSHRGAVHHHVTLAMATSNPQRVEPARRRRSVKLAPRYAGTSTNQTSTAVGGEGQEVEEKKARSSSQKNEADAVDLVREVFTTSTCRCFILKSFSEANMHKSLKYGVWSSTYAHNMMLSQVFQSELSSIRPVLFFFSVCGTRHFSGIARMTSAVRTDASFCLWEKPKYDGYFHVEWLLVKDVPNHVLTDIKMSNTPTKKSITSCRDCEEVLFDEASRFISIFTDYPSHTSAWQDYQEYEQAQKPLERKRGLDEALDTSLLESVLIPHAPLDSL